MITGIYATISVSIVTTYGWSKSENTKERVVNNSLVVRKLLSMISESAMERVVNNSLVVRKLLSMISESAMERVVAIAWLLKSLASAYSIFCFLLTTYPPSCYYILYFD